MYLIMYLEAIWIFLFKNMFPDFNKKYKETKVKHGFGIQIWKDGAKFTGFFIDNKANGWGRFNHIDGDDYAGKEKILFFFCGNFCD